MKSTEDGSIKSGLRMEETEGVSYFIQNKRRELYQVAENEMFSGRRRNLYD